MYAAQEQIASTLFGAIRFSSQGRIELDAYGLFRRLQRRCLREEDAFLDEAAPWVEAYLDVCEELAAEPPPCA